MTDTQTGQLDQAETAVRRTGETDRQILVVQKELQMLFLAEEAPYVISLQEVGWGMLLIAVTITLHGCGILMVLRLMDRMTGRLKKRLSLARDLMILVLGAWLIVLCHLTEVIPWAGFFVWKGAMPNTSTSYYFALLDYTTLGSPLNLPQDWRLLEGLLAIAGLIMFAWSTGVLMVMAQDFQDRHLKRRKSATAESPAAGNGA